MNSVIVRLAVSEDTESILKMPSYAKSEADCLRGKDDVLIAEKNGVVCGAISVGQKDILCVNGPWRRNFGQHLDDVTCRVSGGWISKLYVFPEFRYHGIGSLLIQKAAEWLEQHGLADAYAGVYIKNEFRKVSKDIFRKNGFERVGCCICPLAKGFCRGVLLRKTINSSEK